MGGKRVPVTTDRHRHKTAWRVWAARKDITVDVPLRGLMKGNACDKALTVLVVTRQEQDISAVMIKRDDLAGEFGSSPNRQSKPHP